MDSKESDSTASKQSPMLHARQAHSKRWHSEADHTDVRTQMIKKLQSLHPLLAVATENVADPIPIRYVHEGRVGRINAVELVQRLESRLYFAADSLMEYATFSTLERRVQALVTQLEPNRHRRTRTASGDEWSTSPFKRRWTNPTTSVVVPGTTAARRPRILRRRRVDDGGGGSRLFMDGNLDLLSHVFSFLDGHDVLRSRSVNHLMVEYAFEFVQSLRLDTARHLESDGPTITSLLLRCEQLTRLEITNSHNLKRVQQKQSTPFQGPTAGLSHGQMSGRTLLHSVAQAFHQPQAFPSLYSLKLCDPFDSPLEADAVLPCLEALVRARSTTNQPTTPLTQLVLDATHLGDQRLSSLASLMESNRRCFESLELLALRQNFMGPESRSVLLRALSSCPQLQILDLRENILTDIDAQAIAATLRVPELNGTDDDEQPHEAMLGDENDVLGSEEDRIWLPQLRVLELDGNFIGGPGFCALSSAICTRLLRLSDDEMVLRGWSDYGSEDEDQTLMRVGFAGNCLPEDEAAPLFQF